MLAEDDPVVRKSGQVDAGQGRVLRFDRQRRTGSTQNLPQLQGSNPFGRNGQNDATYDRSGVAESILKKRCEIKIMIMSETAETILNNNTPDAFLPMPFMPATLLTCVQRLLTSEFKGIRQESDLL